MKKHAFAIFVAVPILLSCSPATVGPGTIVDPKEKKDTTVNSFGAYEHVVIMGVDGAGAFFSETVTPNTWKIFANGNHTLDARAATPSISAQCWGSMLHGVPPEAHKLNNSIVKLRAYDPESPYPSIFRVVREGMPDAKLVSICNWSAVNIGIIEDNIGVTKINGGSDGAVTDFILKYLSGENPTLMFVQFDSVDSAGHFYGFGTDGHKRALTDVDRYIGKIYEALEQKGILDKTLFIVTTDHGGTLEKDHGGSSDAEMNTYFGVLGKTVDTKHKIIDAEGQDVASIAVYALGLQAPETWTSRIPKGVFSDVGGTVRKEVDFPVNVFRAHKAEPTPDVSRTRELLKGHKLMAYLPFDGNEVDALEQTGTVRNGKLYYYEGYFGEGVDVTDGYITLTNAKVGTGSFSIAFWIKADTIVGDPAIVSNKNWASGGNDGFVLALRPSNILFNAGCKAKGVRLDGAATLPVDFADGWMHVTLTVDRAKNKVCLYYDFTKFLDYDIPSSFADVSFDALDLNIGQDGRGIYGDRLAVQLDEMIFTSDVLSPDDVAAMKAHYTPVQ
ncbi:MAG: alkaline phosphatase family protein [Bacteroidales bacterium]|nr:alkaline phosphatase family protein [Bacteroidales bacterium]